MKANQKLLLEQHLSNLQVNVSVAALTKVGVHWGETDFIPEFDRFYFICEGEGRIQVGEDIFYPQPGQLVMMPAGVLQSYAAISDNTFNKYWCHFNATIGDMNLFQFMETPYAVDVIEGTTLQQLFEKLIVHNESEELASVLRVKSTLLEIISFYLQSVGLERIQLPASPSIEKVDLILKYIESHLSQNMTIEELAKLVHFHPNYFIQFFKNVLGISPIQYINKARMEKAKLLLMTSDMTVTEISASVGVELYYFSRSFKNYTGFSPSAFRNLLAQ